MYTKTNLGELGDGATDALELHSERLNAIRRHFQRERTLEVLFVVVSEEDGHIHVLVRKNVHVGLPEGVRVVLLLHQIRRQVRVRRAHLVSVEVISMYGSDIRI